MQKLTKKHIVQILKSEDQYEIEKLFADAKKAREEYFGNKIFLYGFVYFTTWCRNDCTFCYYRKSNKIQRYRKEPEEVFQLAKSMVTSGVHLVDLTMGEDLLHHGDDFESVVKLVQRIKTELDIPVMISPGILHNGQIDNFANAGADWYALYQETHNQELFQRLRINQSYDERYNAKIYARTKGMLVEEGIMTGIGETYEDIADSLLKMGEIGASQVRVMSFVPQIGSPMEHHPTPDRMLELKIIALMRLLYPWALIPASLDIDGIKGLQSRLDAGANVVTSIIPPRTGLAGVAQNSMDVDDGGRTVEEVQHILTQIGLESATQEEYKLYLTYLGDRAWQRL